MDDFERLRDLEERLLRADTELSAFFDHSHGLVCELSARGTLRRLNLRWQAELGYSNEEMVSTPLAAFVHSADLATTRNAFTTLRSQDTVKFENRLRHRDGSYRRLRWIATRGRATGIILAIASDATPERKDYDPTDMATREKGTSTVYSLTKRELTTLNLLAEGKTNKQIAAAMKISPVTVNTYVAGILRKMGAASRAEAVARAIRESLVS